MIIKKVDREEVKYLTVVTSYTCEGFKCSLYKLYWNIPVKVHEKIFLRELHYSSKEMIDFTILDYEEGKLSLRS